MPASSGRAKCRGCGRSIAKGELRFGESVPNPYAEGETTYWFHLDCAACMRPEKFVGALDAAVEAVPEEERLRNVAVVGAAHRRLPRIARAERASSGRARCRHCHELVDKGSLRIALQIFEEGRMNPIGYIHVACSEPYFGTRDVLERLARLTPDLTPGDRGELEELLGSKGPRDRLAKTRPDLEAKNDERAAAAGGSRGGKEAS